MTAFKSALSAARSIGFLPLVLANGAIVIARSAAYPLRAKWGRGPLDIVLYESFWEMIPPALIGLTAVVLSSWFAAKRPRHLAGYAWVAFWPALIAAVPAYGTMRQHGGEASLLTFSLFFAVFALLHVCAVGVLWGRSRPLAQP